MDLIFKNSSAFAYKRGGQDYLLQLTDCKDGEDGGGNLTHRGCEEGVRERHKGQTHVDVLGL